MSTSEKCHSFERKDSITLGGAPWNVVAHITVYVQRVGAELKLYSDPDCAGPQLSPADLVVFRNQSTGLYFHIACSPAGTTFADPPVVWEEQKPRPGTVCYGYIMNDGSAFSMSDDYGHQNSVSHSFDLRVDPGDGSRVISTRSTDEVDPTIVERGEEPPGPSR